MQENSYPYFDDRKTTDLSAPLPPGSKERQKNAERMLYEEYGEEIKKMFEDMRKKFPIKKAP